MTLPPRIQLFGETYVPEESASPAATTTEATPVTAAETPDEKTRLREEKKKLREIENGLSYFLDDGAENTLDPMGRNLYKTYCDEIDRQYKKDKAELNAAIARIEARLKASGLDEDDEGYQPLSDKERAALLAQHKDATAKVKDFPGLFDWLKARGIPPFDAWMKLPPQQRDAILINKPHTIMPPSALAPAPVATPTEPIPAGGWWNTNLKFTGWGLKTFNPTATTPPMVMYVRGRTATEIVEVEKYHHPKHIVKEDDLTARMQYEEFKGKYIDDRVIVENFTGKWKRKGKYAGKPYRVTARFMGALILQKSFASKEEAEKTVTKAIADLKRRREKKAVKIKPFFVKVSKVSVAFDQQRIFKVLDALGQGKRYKIRIKDDEFVIQRNKKPTVQEVPEGRNTDAVWIKQFEAYIRLVYTESAG